MTSLQAVDMLRLYFGRIMDSVLCKTLPIYLADKDAQEVAIYNLRQAGEIINRCPDVTRHVAMSEEDAEWVRLFYHMTCDELNDANRVEIWNRISSIVPLVA